MVNHYRKIAKWKNEPWEKLIPKADDVKTDIECRNIIPGRVRGYGNKSHAEVCRCLGIAVTRKSSWNFDPFTGKPIV